MTNPQDPESSASTERQAPSEQQTQFVPQPPAGAPMPPGQQPPGVPYPAPGPDSQQWTTQAAPAYGLPPQHPPYGPGFVPMPPQRPSFFAQLPRPTLLALAASAAGIVTFFMGFLGWITISSDIERKAENWSAGVGDSVNIPAYLTPSLVLSPGWFFLLLGAVAVASAGLVAPKLRRFLPYLAFLSVVGWLGLFVCALGLPPFISLGAGAYVALVIGFAQAALLVVAAVLDGMDPGHPAPPQPPLQPAPTHQQPPPAY
ncbi:DUF5336 domain-containing protein [Gordonia hydrophobica]|uniref:DUF5336 domain-containing protein n=1 Tax=Gordonia hydrophobica TaxID=40516 RepID=A0ABZ2U366_9ACTN|nr:DUF5336 domain-containing protein [Gordonia hydrophobica]MBM7367439.1 hypothetical protein [Gordonia hydrophobica]